MFFMSKVSVIIPVYDVANYIEQCARSLFEQTIDDIEYLFIDDCTPDNSISILYKVLDDYPQRKNQVVVHQMESNSGQAAVRKWGILNATGDYIIHCDSDDWIDRDLCRLMYEKAIDEASDIVICDYLYVINDNLQKRIKGCYGLRQEKLIEDLLNEKISWSVCNKLVKRQLYQDTGILFPDDNMGEDMAIILQLILRTNNISYVPDAFYYYRSNPISISNFFSEAAVWNKYMQVRRNTEIVISAFKEYGLNNRFNLSFLKWNVRKTLWRITYKNEYRRVWCNTYPEIFPSLFFSSLLSLQDKFKIMLTYLRIYPQVPSSKKDLLNSGIF